MWRYRLLAVVLFIAVMSAFGWTLHHVIAPQGHLALALTVASILLLAYVISRLTGEIT